jgi:hypothetical protein
MNMPHPSKKQRLAVEANLSVDNVTVGNVSIDVLANILGYLDGPKDIMQKRRVCKKWKDAVKMTIVPPSYFRVDSVDKYSAVDVMTRVMPNLQQIALRNLDIGDKYSDGEDPHGALAVGTANWITHDIEIISNFNKLQILDIYGTVLNGRYPFLFNRFPLLEKLSIIECDYLKWDLEMLSGFPLLKELECGSNGLSGINKCLTGNINSLRVLKDTLEKVSIIGCENVEGNFMDLADFPHLKMLNLFGTAVTGDIRDIGVNDFTILENLELPKGVYGGRCYELHRISDGLDLMKTLNLFVKKRPNLIDSFEHLYWTLMEGSPEWYESADFDDYDTPPFNIC